MTKDAVFECSVVGLSVIIELLPGLIPFTSKWHAGQINTLKIDYCFLTTTYEMDIRTHSVVMSHRGAEPAGKCIFHEFFFKQKW